MSKEKRENQESHPVTLNKEALLLNEASNLGFARVTWKPKPWGWIPERLSPQLTRAEGNLA